METSRKVKMMFRFSLVSAALIALFWTAWYMVAGSVPEVQSIGGNQGLYFAIPISRWWDILIGPIWSVALILIFTSERITQDEDLTPGLAFIMAVSLLAGSLVCRLAGPDSADFDRSLSLALGIILVVGLAFNLVFDSNEGRKDCLIFGLAFSLTFGLVFGLNFGLAIGLIVAAAAAVSLIISLGSGGGILMPFCLNLGLAISLSSGKVSLFDVNGPIAGLGAGIFLGLAFGALVGLVFILGKELLGPLPDKKTWQIATGWLLAK